MMRHLIDQGLMARVDRLLKAQQDLPRPQLPDGHKGIEVQAQADGPTEVFIYSEIGFWGLRARDVVDALAGVEGDLHVRINSPGGSVFDGCAIYNHLLNWDGRITGSVDGLAASAASFIAMACDELEVQRASQMMIHDASGLCVGNASDMAEMAALLERVSAMIAEIYADKAGGTADDWRDAMRAETWYAAEEAVTAGLADKIAPSRHQGDDGEEDDTGPEEGAENSVFFNLAGFNFAGRDSAPPPKLPESTACPQHDTALKDGTWDAGAEKKKLADPVPVATAKKMFALYDESRVEDGALPKDACSLPHHFVSADGTPGAASRNGVNAALGRLPQTEGYSQAEKDAAERHLRNHLPDSEEDLGGGPAGEQHNDEPRFSLDPAAIARAFKEAGS